MSKIHQYNTQLEWMGNKGEGTSGYRTYSRDYTITVAGKAPIQGSSDPSFLGDPTRYNPEEMLVAALSACHMLWYLHLCAAAGVVVEAYRDRASGTMEETSDGGGRFTRVVLSPEITLRDHNLIAKADGLHEQANRLCFIANSCNFPVVHEATYPSLSGEKNGLAR